MPGSSACAAAVLAANERVLVVGHNPAVSMLASVLVGEMLSLSPCTLLELRLPALGTI